MRAEEYVGKIVFSYAYGLGRIQMYLPDTSSGAIFLIVFPYPTAYVFLDKHDVQKLVDNLKNLTLLERIVFGAE